jgi:transposase
MKSRAQRRRLIGLATHEEANPLPVTARVALQPLAVMLVDIEAQIAKLDKAILAAHRSDQVSIRLAAIPGIGPIVASCLSASIPDASVFQCGREFAAYLGLVPRQHSTGGKPRLGSISLLAKKPFKVVAVALANKMSRIAWAVMARNSTFEPGLKRTAAQAAS